MKIKIRPLPLPQKRTCLQKHVPFFHLTNKIIWLIRNYNSTHIIQLLACHGNVQTWFGVWSMELPLPLISQSFSMSNTQLSQFSFALSLSFVSRDFECFTLLRRYAVRVAHLCKGVLNRNIIGNTIMNFINMGLGVGRWGGGGGGVCGDSDRISKEQRAGYQSWGLQQRMSTV